MERHDKSYECSVEFAIREVGPGAHAGTGAVGVVGSSRTFRVSEIAVDGEGFGVFEMRFIEVGGPGVLFSQSVSDTCNRVGEVTCHVECGSCRDNSFFVFDILDTCSWQADGNHCEESQDFSHERGYIGNFLFFDTFLPCVAIGVDFLDLLVGALLNFLAVLGGKVGDTHDKVARDCIKTCGDHGQADGFDLVCGSLLARFSV